MASPVLSRMNFFQKRYRHDNSVHRLSGMRTGADFDNYYKKKRDPWGAFTNKFTREYLFEWIFKKYVTGRSAMELGCGEGYHSEVISQFASHVTGVDISEVALQRARERNIANAEFVKEDFLNVDFEKSECLIALECIYYLEPQERQKFFDRVDNWLSKGNRYFIFSTPIIGGNNYRYYFSMEDLSNLFTSKNWRINQSKKLNLYFDHFKGGSKFIFKLIDKLLHPNVLKITTMPIRILQMFDDNLVYQKVFVASKGENS